jgi:hypothetical protein
MDLGVSEASGEVLLNQQQTTPSPIPSFIPGIVGKTARFWLFLHQPGRGARTSFILLATGIFNIQFRQAKYNPCRELDVEHRLENIDALQQLQSTGF